MRLNPVLSALRAAALLVALLAPLPAAAQTDPAPAARTPIDTAPREGRRALGLNLAEVTGWTTQLPFIDVMRSASRWVGHLPGQWGGMEDHDLLEAGALDAEGWVVAIPRNVRRISTFVLQDLPAGMTSASGRWHVRWEGSAHLGFTGAARNVRYGDNSASFDFTAGDGSVLIEFNRGTLRHLTVVHERHLERFAAGEVFNPDWLALVGDAENLRFMDWMRTNNSPVSGWDQRPRIGDYSWSWRGVPLEIMLRLANDTGAEPWFTLPHLADDAYVRQFATQVRDGLRPDLRGWFEFSNEVWNWGFGQAQWAEDTARARWNREWAWVQYGAVRAAEVMGVIDSVYGDQTARRVRVLGLFTAWLGLEEDMLNGPDYVAEDPAHRPPHESFDALAVTGYFSGALHDDRKRDLVRGWLRDSLAAAEAEADTQGLTGSARADFVQAHRFDRAVALAGQELLDGGVSGDPEHSVRDLLDRTLAHHVAVAGRYGLALVMYEGGTHVVTNPADHGDTEMVEFFIALNHAPQMGDLYRALISGWQALTPAPFYAYNDVSKPSIWGSWGALRHLDDANPRWDALMEATE